jgi:glycosyltransferase involved in cell wall biosynthesis
MVSTSLSEAFGRVLAEATAAKIPVLSHPHDAAIEIIAHELSFVDMEKPGELADRLKTINENEPLRENMVDKNYSYCLNTFDWSLLNLKYSSMYKSVLYKDK